MKIWTVVFHNRIRDRVRIYNYNNEDGAVKKVNYLYKDFKDKNKLATYTTPEDNYIKISDINNENILCEIHWNQNSLLG